MLTQEQLAQFASAWWTASDLNMLLAALEKQGVIVNSGDNPGEIFILSDWKHNRGDIMFAAQATGRVRDTIMYKVWYSPLFDKAMSENTVVGIA